MWLVIVGGGLILHFVSRALGWPEARTWSEVGDRLFMVGAPWQIQALYLAIIGGGSTYHLATGSHRWFWWLLPAVAWSAFVEVLLHARGGKVSDT